MVGSGPASFDGRGLVVPGGVHSTCFLLAIPCSTIACRRASLVCAKSWFISARRIAGSHAVAVNTLRRNMGMGSANSLLELARKPNQPLTSVASHSLLAPRIREAYPKNSLRTFISAKMIAGSRAVAVSTLLRTMVMGSSNSLVELARKPNPPLTSVALHNLLALRQREAYPKNSLRTCSTTCATHPKCCAT